MFCDIDSLYPCRHFLAEKQYFFRVCKTQRFAPAIRQYSNRSDLPYVPIIDTFLSYERSLLRSFGSPGLRFDLPKKVSKLFQGKLFQGGKTFPGESFPGRQNFSRENFSRGNVSRGNCEMHLPNSCSGVNKYGAASYTAPPRGPDEVATRC